MRCYSPTPLKEISSRDLRREVASTKTNEGCIDHGDRKISGQLEGGKLLGLSSNFSFCEWVT
jgi:hypothetical protein